MKKITFCLLLFVALQAAAQQKNYTDYTAKKIEQYKKNAQGRPFFVPLEIGEITPKGWIADWANTAANGITGHLDEYVDVFKKGWMGFGFNARGVNEDGTGWPLEQCSYWLDGAVKLGYILHDTMLIRKTSTRLNMVVNGVLNGGETFIYWKPYSIVNDGFNNWGHGLMGRALVSYYQATHDPKILEALIKVYKRFPLKNNADEFMQLNRGTTNIDAMSETFLMSGEKCILDSIVAYSKYSLTTKTVDDWNNIREHFVPGADYNGVHGVSFYEIMRVPAMMHLWTGSNDELNASENILQWGENSSLLPFGVCSSEEYLAGTGSTRNTETCNVPTSMWSFLWMLRLTGDSRWSDKIENVFFNAGPAPVARDFKTMCYYQSPNRMEGIPETVPVPGKGDLDFTDHGHEVLCCVGNVNNTIPDYISNMWMATLDGGLAATLYGPCRVEKKIKNADIVVDCNTNYPFDDRIEINILPSKQIEMPVYLRIPDWCKKYSITLNGKAIVANVEKGFVKISRVWKGTNKLVLVLPMNIELHQGHENAYPQIAYFLKGFGGLNSQPAAVNTHVNNPFEFVTYGPLLFSLPIQDISPNQQDLIAKYNYALNVNTATLASDVTIIKKPMPAKWSWQINESPVQLKVNATQFNFKPTALHPLPNALVKASNSTIIKLVPYGCTKFRITMFPLTE